MVFALTALSLFSISPALGPRLVISAAEIPTNKKDDGPKESGEVPVLSSKNPVKNSEMSTSRKDHRNSWYQAPDLLIWTASALTKSDDKDDNDTSCPDSAPKSSIPTKRNSTASEEACITLSKRKIRIPTEQCAFLPRIRRNHKPQHDRKSNQDSAPKSSNPMPPVSTGSEEACITLGPTRNIKMIPTAQCAFHPRIKKNRKPPPGRGKHHKPAASPSQKKKEQRLFTREPTASDELELVKALNQIQQRSKSSKSGLHSSLLFSDEEAAHSSSGPLKQPGCQCITC